MYVANYNEAAQHLQERKLIKVCPTVLVTNRYRHGVYAIPSIHFRGLAGTHVAAHKTQHNVPGFHKHSHDQLQLVGVASHRSTYSLVRVPGYST